MSQASFQFEERALLIVDQEPIRAQATEEIHSLHSRLRKARHQISEFEDVDRPAFARWLRTEFHEPLTAIARLQTKVADSEELVSEVQMIRFATGCSYYQAYVSAMERRRRGTSAADDFEDDSEQTSFDDEEFDSKEEKNRREKDEEPEDDGESFERESGSHSESSSSNSKRGHSQDDDREGLFSKARRFSEDVGESIKHKYRELARMLHPDLRSGGDAWTNDLWLRTQTAYQERDASELDNLLILCRISFGGQDKESTISDMKSAILFLKKSLTSLRRQMSRLRQDMAWSFTKLKDRTRLRRRISYDLENEQDELSERLEALEAQLGRWSVPPAPRRARGGRRSSSSTWDLDF